MWISCLSDQNNLFGFFHTLFLSIFVNCQQPAPTASLPFRNISAVGLCTLCFESSVGGIFFSANVNKIGRRMSSCDLNPAEVSLFGLTPIFGLTARLSPSLVSVCSCRTSPLKNNKPFSWPYWSWREREMGLSPFQSHHSTLEIWFLRRGCFKLSIKREAASYLSIGL